MAVTAIDMTGKRIGKWTVIRRDRRRGDNNAHWLCRCECGTVKRIDGCELRRGHSRACGCSPAVKHGHTAAGSRTGTYRTWDGMRARCTNPRSTTYYKYGARGITMCERWLDYRNFLADMGERPEGMSIERIDNSGNYEPSNCRWATSTEQSRNRRSNSRITYKGETLCLSEWEERLGMKSKTLWQRIRKYGWSVDRAMTTPQLA